MSHALFDIHIRVDRTDRSFAGENHQLVTFVSNRVLRWSAPDIRIGKFCYQLRS
jgi:hypothetical protein